MNTGEHPDQKVSLSGYFETETAVGEGREGVAFGVGRRVPLDIVAMGLSLASWQRMVEVEGRQKGENGTGHDVDVLYALLKEI